MITRTPDMNCMLCGSAKATATGSHFVPNWMLQPSVGKRDAEKVGSIDLSQREIEEHFGRDRLDNPSTEITQNPHVTNYVFCPQCEKRLADLENKAAPFLKQNIHWPRYVSQFIIGDLGEGAIMKVSKQFPAKPFHLFIYSLVWRQCLQHRLASGNSCLNPRIEESLRLALAAGVSRPLSEIDQTDWNLTYPYTVLTSDGIPDGSVDYIAVDPTPDNPTAFLLPKFIVLLHGDDQMSPTGKGLSLATRWSDVRLAHCKAEDVPKLVFVPLKAWQDAMQHANAAAQTEWAVSAAYKLADAKGLAPEDAYVLLLNKAEGISGIPGTIKMEAIQQALEQLLKDDI